MLSEAIQEPVTSTSIYLYVPNVDAVFYRAVAAGAQATMPVADMFEHGSGSRDVAASACVAVMLRAC